MIIGEVVNKVGNLSKYIRVNLMEQGSVDTRGLLREKNEVAITFIRPWHWV